MKEDAAPLYNELAGAPEHGRAFWLRAGRRRIRAAVWEGSGRGTVLIFNGRTEYIEKYGAVVAALVGRGFAVATLDWRGQGLSDRALPNPLKGHVGEFAAYQRDIDALLAAPAFAALGGPLVLLCHSMGGCIGTRALLEERVAPAATIFSAPMLGLSMSPPVRLFARLAVSLSDHFGWQSAFAPNPGGSKPYALNQAFDGNVLTSDEESYLWFRRQLEAEPGFALAGPTLGWLGAALSETEALAAGPAPETPALYFLGTDEAVVEPEAIRAQVAKSAEAQLVELPGARHEAFMERPEIQERLWDEIDRFLRSRRL